MTRHTWRITPIVGLVLASTLAATAASAVDIRGTFKYQDTRGPMPIRRCYVEIWFHGTGFFDTWNPIAARTTDSSGRISYVDGIGSGTFSLRVYAMNDAAIVRQTDFPLAAFYVATTNLVPTSSTSILDFSSTFTDEYTSRHFNVANSAQFGFEYAAARRDPMEGDTISQVNILPSTSSWPGQKTYFNAVTNTIMIQVAETSSDLIVLHEYGHHLQQDISRAAGGAGFHDGCQIQSPTGGGLANSPETAWNEGFPQYFAHAVARGASLNPSIDVRPSSGSWGFPAAETPARCALIGTSGPAGVITGAMVESTIEAVLWDLLDGYGNPSQGVETFDHVSGEERTVFQIFDHEIGLANPANIFTFRDAWRARGKDAAALDCIMSAYGMLPATPGCTGSGSVKIVGRFNGDQKSDIALTGVAGWSTIPVALSNGDGSFNVVNQGAGDFPSLAAVPGVAKIAGDFNHDGLTDIALARGQGWGSIPVALSDGNGGFTFVNTVDLTMFPMFAAEAEAQVVAGDFDGNGCTDLAVVGVATWTWIPVAYSDCMGQFNETVESIANFFQVRASVLGTRVFVGDLDGDSKSDILLIQPGSSLLPWARSLGDGLFEVKFISVGEFGTWSAGSGAQILAGDFNGDHMLDLALSGVPGWTTVPMMLSAGAGQFTIVNASVGDFGTWSAATGATHLIGDFSGNGTSDIFLTGVNGWTTLPVAISYGSTYTVANPSVGLFAGWSTAAGVQPLVGDFNGDGRADVALTGVAGWNTLPVAFASGAKTLTKFGVAVDPNVFRVTNLFIGDFATWASSW